MNILQTYDPNVVKAARALFGAFLDGRRSLSSAVEQAGYFEEIDDKYIHAGLDLLLGRKLVRPVAGTEGRQMFTCYEPAV